MGTIPAIVTYYDCGEFIPGKNEKRKEQIYYGISAVQAQSLLYKYDAMGGNYWCGLDAF